MHADPKDDTADGAEQETHIPPGETAANAVSVRAPSSEGWQDPTANARRASRASPSPLVFPAAHFSKQDLRNYFERVGAWMLPHLAGRPLLLARFPQTIWLRDPGPEQRGLRPHTAHWQEWSELPLRRLAYRKSPLSRTQRDDIHALVSLVQRDVVEIYTAAATDGTLKDADRITFNLEPGASVTELELLSAARAARDVLEWLGLRCWPKLTGTKVLQLVVPFAPARALPMARAAAALIESAIVSHVPNRFSRVALAAGRILIEDETRRTPAAS
ncbi:MAG TPA: hypothetical protein VMF89_34585, partial [Polyangiales bacterium]|nr:hypothetical protein [Polyangiales bacterium]